MIQWSTSFFTPSHRNCSAHNFWRQINVRQSSCQTNHNLKVTTYYYIMSKSCHSQPKAPSSKYMGKRELREWHWPSGRYTWVQECPCVAQRAWSTTHTSSPFNTSQVCTVFKNKEEIYQQSLADTQTHSELKKRLDFSYHIVLTGTCFPHLFIHEK